MSYSQSSSQLASLLASQSQACMVRHVFQIDRIFWPAHGAAAGAGGVQGPSPGDGGSPGVARQSAGRESRSATPGRGKGGAPPLYLQEQPTTPARPRLPEFPRSEIVRAGGLLEAKKVQLLHPPWSMPPVPQHYLEMLAQHPHHPELGGERGPRRIKRIDWVQLNSKLDPNEHIRKCDLKGEQGVYQTGFNIFTRQFQPLIEREFQFPNKRVHQKLLGLIWKQLSPSDQLSYKERAINVRAVGFNRERRTLNDPLFRSLTESILRIIHERKRIGEHFKGALPFHSIEKLEQEHSVLVNKMRREDQLKKNEPVRLYSTRSGLQVERPPPPDFHPQPKYNEQRRHRSDDPRMFELFFFNKKDRKSRRIGNVARQPLKRALYLQIKREHKTRDKQVEVKEKRMNKLLKMTVLAKRHREEAKRREKSDIEAALREEDERWMMLMEDKDQYKYETDTQSEDTEEEEADEECSDTRPQHKDYYSQEEEEEEEVKTKEEGTQQVKAEVTDSPKLMSKIPERNNKVREPEGETKESKNGVHRERGVEELQQAKQEEEKRKKDREGQRQRQWQRYKQRQRQREKKLRLRIRWRKPTRFSREVLRKIEEQGGVKKCFVAKNGRQTKVQEERRGQQSQQNYQSPVLGRVRRLVCKERLMTAPVHVQSAFTPLKLTNTMRARHVSPLRSPYMGTHLQLSRITDYRATPSSMFGRLPLSNPLKKLEPPKPRSPLRRGPVGKGPLLIPKHAAVRGKHPMHRGTASATHPSVVRAKHPMSRVRHPMLKGKHPTGKSASTPYPASASAPRPSSSKLQSGGGGARQQVKQEHAQQLHQKHHGLLRHRKKHRRLNKEKHMLLRYYQLQRFHRHLKRLIQHRHRPRLPEQGRRPLLNVRRKKKV